MIVTDRLKQDIIFESYKTIKAKNAAKIFIQVVRQYGLSGTITSDHRIQFVSDFWKALCKRFGIEQQLSTVYHSETDGTTERINQTLEQYLRYFISFHQDDGLKLLSLTEYTINNGDTSATEMNPFFIEHGYYRSIGAEMNKNVKNEHQLQQSARNSINYANHIQDVINHLRKFMKLIQIGYKEQMNHYQDLTSQFAIEDLVGLNLQNIKTIRPYKKLDTKNIKY